MMHPDIRTELARERMRAIEQEAQSAARFDALARPARTEQRSRFRLRPAFLTYRRGATAETLQTPRVRPAGS